MNKQELQNKIEDLEKQLAELKEQVNSPEFEGIKKGVRQMPEYDERYYYIDDSGVIISTPWYGTDSDIFRFNTGNCFKTEQEAEDFKENILTKQALKDLALELNNGVEICWKNSQECKYYVFTHSLDGGLHTTSTTNAQSMGEVYCLNKDFIDIAKDRIGEEKLIKLIKSGV